MELTSVLPLPFAVSDGAAESAARTGYGAPAPRDFRQERRAATRLVARRSVMAQQPFVIYPPLVKISLM